MLQLKCLESSKAFKKGKVYLGVAKDNHKGSYYKVEGENGRTYLCKADKFQVLVEEVEANNVVEGVTTYNLDLPLGKRLKAVHDLGLKKGDAVTIVFEDGQKVSIQVERVGFMRRQTTNNRMIDRFYIEDPTGLGWNLYTAKTIRIDYRNPKSKKVLTKDLKQCHDYMEYVLADEKVKKYNLERKIRKEEAEALIDKLAKEINDIVEKNKEELHQAKERLAGRKSTLTRKQAIEVDLKAKGYKLGCYDRFIDKLTVANVKEIMYYVGLGSATDVVIRQNMKDYVVSIDFVDGEVDFTTYTKAEYIDRFGSEKFED